MQDKYILEEPEKTFNVTSDQLIEGKFYESDSGQIVMRITGDYFNINSRVFPIFNLSNSGAGGYSKTISRKFRLLPEGTKITLFQK